MPKTGHVVHLRVPEAGHDLVLGLVPTTGRVVHLRVSEASHIVHLCVPDASLDLDLVLDRSIDTNVHSTTATTMRNDHVRVHVRTINMTSHQGQTKKKQTTPIFCKSCQLPFKDTAQLGKHWWQEHVVKLKPQQERVTEIKDQKQYRAPAENNYVSARRKPFQIKKAFQIKKPLVVTYQPESVVQQPHFLTGTKKDQNGISEKYVFCTRVKTPTRASSASDEEVVDLQK